MQSLLGICTQGRPLNHGRLCDEFMMVQSDGAVGAAMAVGRILAGDTGPGIYETEAGQDGFRFV